MILAAVMEMATVAAAIPLVGSLIDSQSDTSNFLSGSLRLPDFIANADDPHTWVLAMAVIVVCVAAVVRILVIRMSAEFSARVGVDLQVRYFRYLLNRDYETAINESSSKSISLISNKIQIVISNYILGMLTTLTSIVSAIGVIIVLLWLSTAVVFLALGLLISSYVLIAWFSRLKLKKYGRDLQVYFPQKVRCVQEGLGGFRDVTMGGSQDVFANKFSTVTTKVEKAGARLVFYNRFPRPLVEAIGISSIAGIAWLSHKGIYSSDNLMPILGVFALGMLRLLPFVQQIFGQWAKVFNGQMILAELMTVLVHFEDRRPGDASYIKKPTIDLSFEKSITLTDVCFGYQGVEKSALEHISFTINKGDYVGIVGPTGSGKSTLVDLLMGLLLPSSGMVAVDDTLLEEGNLEQWRRQVAHVPQKIYLSEGSIESNIAFGVAKHDIDSFKVAECARKACIEEFILSLPAGYNTHVGEDGVRLSGGQRQRIGIARALYSDCKVLVFDEATNALDEATERLVVDGLLSQTSDYTIVVVTHNLASVNHCHRVLTIASGRAEWQ